MCALAKFALITACNQSESCQHIFIYRNLFSSSCNIEKVVNFSSIGFLFPLINFLICYL